MMTLSMPSAVYQPSDKCPSFTDLKHGSEKVGQPANGETQSTAAASKSIPTVNLNAAISSSLNLKNGQAAPQNSSLELLDKTISFHRSPATPLDKLIKSRIENMPNSLVLMNKQEEKSTG